MQPFQNISIPQPCHQNWNLMTPVEQGRHCTECSKTVIDFSTMSNARILNFLASRENVCGRFAPHQLDSVNGAFAAGEKRKPLWKVMAMAAALTSLFITTKGYAQRTMGEIPISQTLNPSKASILGATVITKAITGKIIDKNDYSPLPGVTVRVKGTANGTQTNANGEFTLMVRSDTATLHISYIGYESMEVRSMDLAKEVNCLSLKMKPALLGEVVYVRKVRFYEKWWRSLKHIFN